MASNSSEEHAKLNECKDSLTKYVTAIKRDFRKNPKGVIGALIVLLLSCALSFAVAVNIATETQYSVSHPELRITGTRG